MDAHLLSRRQQGVRGAPVPARARRAVLDGRADLHVHSVWSDGAQSPDAIVRAASGRVDVLAIADHDEIRGARLARDFARRHPELGVDVVVGEVGPGRRGAAPRPARRAPAVPVFGYLAAR